MLQLVFMGTPDFAVPTLLELVGAGHEIRAVYTRAPKPAGRGMAEQPTPVAREAERLGIPVFTPATLRGEEAQAQFASLGADAAVVVAYGLILPQGVLDTVPLGCFNLHASKLPRWRGAAPIQRAIMAGDAATAASIMKMEAGLDTGPVVLAEDVAIGPDTTAGELHDVLARLGAGLMVRALAAIERGTAVLRLQPADGVTYAQKIDKAEARIDWTRPAREIHNLCRGLSPFPGAWFALPEASSGARVKVLRTSLREGVWSAAPGTVLDDALTVACGDGAVQLRQVQRAGKQPMAAADFLRGQPLPAGTRLG